MLKLLKCEWNGDAKKKRTVFSDFFFISQRWVSSSERNGFAENSQVVGLSWKIEQFQLFTVEVCVLRKAEHFEKLMIRCCLLSFRSMEKICKN